MDQELKIGDIVQFQRTIWQGKIGKIRNINTDGKDGIWIRVYVPGTLCHVLHEYVPSAVKKIDLKGKENVVHAE